MPDGGFDDIGMPLGAVAKRLGVKKERRWLAIVGGSTPSAPTKSDSGN